MKVVAAGVRHTGLKCDAPGSRVPFPMVLRHEGAGVVKRSARA